jgi:hypothetical protein
VCPLILVKDFCEVMSALQAIYILRSAGTFFQFAWWFSYSSEGIMLVNPFCRQPVSLTVIDFSESGPTHSQSSHGKGRFWYFQVNSPWIVGVLCIWKSATLLLNLWCMVVQLGLPNFTTESDQTKTGNWSYSLSYGCCEAQILGSNFNMQYPYRQEMSSYNSTTTSSPTLRLRSTC